MSGALRDAAAKDDIALVRSLIDDGASPYDTDGLGRTAFNYAASNGLRALDLMTRAAFEDTQKPVSQRRWPQYGLNTPSGYYNSTLITYAAKVCDAEFVWTMIDAGADIAIVNGSGWTLLHCAAVMPVRLEVLDVLIEAFETRGFDSLIHALTTQRYETEYHGKKVVFEKGLSAAELCRARLAQDPDCPAYLGEYLKLRGFV